jgi:hypothetical protein
VLVHYLDDSKKLDLLRVTIFNEITIGRWVHDIAIVTTVDIGKGVILPERCTVYMIPHDHHPIAILQIEELRKYKVIQYQDIHAVIISQLRVFYEAEFHFETMLVMDYPPCDKEGHSSAGDDMSSVLPPVKSRDMERRIMIGQFPGADDPNNGPNHSPAGGLQAYAILTSKIPEDVISRYNQIRMRYSSLVHAQVFMFTFWGEFKAMSFHSLCREPISAQMKASILWTCASQNPALPDSPYHGAFVMSKRAMDAQNAVTITKLRG